MFLIVEASVPKKNDAILQTSVNTLLCHFRHIMSYERGLFIRAFVTAWISSCKASSLGSEM